MFYKYKPRLEEDMSAYRISKFHSDQDLLEFNNRHFAPYIYFFFNKSLVHDFSTFHSSDWVKRSVKLLESIPQGCFLRSPKKYILGSFLFVFESLWTSPFFDVYCTGVCVPEYADHLNAYNAEYADLKMHCYAIYSLLYIQNKLNYECCLF